LIKRRYQFLTYMHLTTLKKTLMELKAQIDSNTVIMRDLNTQLSSIDRSYRQKNQHRNFRTKPHIRPNGHNRLLQSISPNCLVDWILGHKASLNKFKKVEINPCNLIISDHNRIKLELNNKRNHRKHSNTWRLNNTLLNDQWVTKKIKKLVESN
jgi:endonuclease/exonuclease/phosphatase family metal-dependent hydrolase